MTALSLSFQDIQFDVVDQDGQPWLKSSEVATALGYSRPDALNKIYERNKDEFTDAMTRNVKLTLRNENKELQHILVRIFSLRGCHLLGMLSRTTIAKEFRKWVLDILDKEVGQQPVSNPDKFISKEQEGILFNLMAIRFPEGKDRPYCWSRFNRHFVVSSYKNLPASKFAEACIYIPSMPDKEVKALPAPAIKPPVWTKPDPAGVKGAVRNIETTKKLIAELKVWTNTLPREIGDPLWDALNDLNSLLIRGWTEVDEALTCINQGMYYLHRWQGRNGRIGNVR